METENKPVIHTAATAHLDTVWNWSFEKTLKYFIKSTLDKNFRLFEKYPDYVFSFEGSRRYELMEEYYPIRFEKLKKYIADERWFVTGSAYENGDVNVPSPEALFRNILFGTDYFDKKFGKKSVDIYLPDCFGFGYALPTIMKHCGLKGFTTQKLTWSSAFGIPFDLGYWQGVDGSKVFASLNALSYAQTLEKVRKNKKIKEKLDNNIKQYDLPMTYVLYGTGDIGGSPKDLSVQTVVREKNRNTLEDTEVSIESVDNIFRVMDKLPEDAKNRLPVWNNELVSTNHGVGGYTSRAIGKRWNKRNEQLADAAERSSVLASWLGAEKYPADVLDTAWKRVIAHQFHDDLPGTSLNRVYKRSWNEYMLSLNQFASCYENAVSGIASMVKTPNTKGVAVIVSNTVDCELCEPVECVVDLPADTEFIKVKNCEGKEVASQFVNGKAVFTATVPGNGYAVYTILPAAKPFAKKNGLTVTDRTLENCKYKVTLNDNGDIASVYDKEANREVLQNPVSMDIFSYEGSRSWPAWELDFPEVMAAPEGKANNPKFYITESGAARVVLETVRHYGDSVFTQKIILGEKSKAVSVENEIEWRGLKKLLKTPFEFTVSNKEASYDLGLGVIKRGTNTKLLYEVPGQNWADISDDDFGVSVFSDSKYGWDHPMNNILRLTGIHTPAEQYHVFSRQDLMDLGRNRYSFGIFSHSGSDLAATQQYGAAFSRPMSVFKAVAGNNGVLPAEYSFISVNDNGVMIKAVKKELNGNRIIIRFAEGAGKAHSGVRLKMGNGISSAAEVNGIEETVGAAVVENGELVFDIEPYSPKTFAVVLKPLGSLAQKVKSTDIALNCNIKVTSPNARRTNGRFDGCSIPSELFPKTVRCKNAVFKLAEKGANALECRGQTIELPENTKSVALLVTSSGGDKRTFIECNNTQYPVFIPDSTENIGAWDLFGLGMRGYVKPCVLAHEITHTHKATGDAYAKQCWMFRVDVPAEGALTLPNDPDILVFSAVAFEEEQKGGVLHELYDSLEKDEFDFSIPMPKFKLVL